MFKAMTKRIFTLLVCLCMMILGLPAGVLALDESGASVIQAAKVAAAEADPPTEAEAVAPFLEGGDESPVLSAEHVNPLYADLYSAADPYGVSMLAETESVVIPDAEASFAEDEKDALAAFMREKALARATDMCFTYISDDYTKTEATSGAAVQLAYDFWSAMCAHTGVPTEGDALLWQYGTWALKCKVISLSNAVKYVFYYYNITFYTTAEQEEILASKVEEILAALALEGKSDYEKLCSIYDYVTANVSYDSEHLYDASYKLKHTAYAALCNGTAVCQGYALAIYRLCLESGIDCRLVPGISNGQNHGWNILQLGDLYYHVDATWDAGKSEYVYFLKGSETLSGHTSDEKLGTEKVLGLHSVSPDDFDIRDQNGSGELEAVDLVLLMKRLVGVPFERYISTPDINGDGLLDVLDVIRLSAALAKI